jgi:hypothetical protein
MEKKFRTIGVNTDPLSVQLYFDENNTIKSKIIFKENVTYDQTDKTTNIVEKTEQIDNIQKNNDKKDILILSNIFSNIFIVGCKNKYNFKYNEIQLELNESNKTVNEINYESFDYLKYNKIIGENLLKNIAWKHYMKNIRNNININLDLTSIEISEINSLIDIINICINNGHKECLIIFGDFIINNTNLSSYIKNKNKYEITSAKIILVYFESFVLSDETAPNKIKISNVSSPKTIKGFVIKSSIYDSFLNKLNQKTISWQSCLAQLIDENQFNSFQINPQILS